jgi:hypothetical protein
LPRMIMRRFPSRRLCLGTAVTHVESLLLPHVRCYIADNRAQSQRAKERAKADPASCTLCPPDTGGWQGARISLRGKICRNISLCAMQMSPRKAFDFRRGDAKKYLIAVSLGGGLCHRHKSTQRKPRRSMEGSQCK